MSGDIAPLSPDTHLSPMSPWRFVERDALLQVVGEGEAEEGSQPETQELRKIS